MSSLWYSSQRRDPIAIADSSQAFSVNIDFQEICVLAKIQEFTKYLPNEIRFDRNGFAIQYYALLVAWELCEEGGKGRNKDNAREAHLLVMLNQLLSVKSVAENTTLFAELFRSTKPPRLHEFVKRTCSRIIEEKTFNPFYIARVDEEGDTIRTYKSVATTELVCSVFASNTTIASIAMGYYDFATLKKNLEMGADNGMRFDFSAYIMSVIFSYGLNNLVDFYAQYYLKEYFNAGIEISVEAVIQGYFARFSSGISYVLALMQALTFMPWLENPESRQYREILSRRVISEETRANTYMRFYCGNQIQKYGDLVLCAKGGQKSEQIIQILKGFESVERNNKFFDKTNMRQRPQDAGIMSDIEEAIFNVSPEIRGLNAIYPPPSPLYDERIDAFGIYHRPRFFKYNEVDGNSPSRIIGVASGGGGGGDDGGGGGGGGGGRRRNGRRAAPFSFETPPQLPFSDERDEKKGPSKLVFQNKRRRLRKSFESPYKIPIFSQDPYYINKPPVDNENKEPAFPLTQPKIQNEQNNSETESGRKVDRDFFDKAREEVYGACQPRSTLLHAEDNDDSDEEEETLLRPSIGQESSETDLEIKFDKDFFDKAREEVYGAYPPRYPRSPLLPPPEDD
jgi:uncharacterized membrane protein YgcG